MKDFDLKTIQDVIRYWRHECVEQLPGRTKQQIGAWMAGASGYSTDDFDIWYKQDEDFMNLYEDALSLEMESDYINVISYWESIEEELQKLEKRYL